jgi:hypothetical protein
MGYEKMKHSTIAFDSSHREYDNNGFLHVRACNLTREQVAPYYGREIPNYEQAGFDPDTVYYGYRSAEELSRPETVKSINGIPIQLRHHLDYPDAPAKETRVGQTGTDGVWQAPFLKNSLHILDKAGIDAVNGDCRELSLAYAYRPEFISGETADGTHYDFVMRDILAQHLALVESGRAGREVVVCDSSLKENEMPIDEKKPDDGTLEEKKELEGGKADGALDCPVPDRRNRNEHHRRITMAFPKLLQRLFQNNGAGDKLNQDIIPDIPYSKVTDAPSVDSALSSTSENPVQNKVINSALDGKLSASGGTVNGSITVDGGNYRGLVRGAGTKNFEIRGADNDGCLSFWPGEDGTYAAKKSASLFLTSTDCTGKTIAAGTFALSAMDATTGAKSLVGSPDGSLTWCGKSLTGGLTVVAESYSANSWYRKYSDGWIEQGGKASFSSRETLVITLPLAFSNTNYTPIFSTNASGTSWLAAIYTTFFSLDSNSTEADAWWYACGK